MKPRRHLRVYPNPYKHVDEQGRPNFAVACEPVGNGVTSFDDRSWIGATLTATPVAVFAPGDARSSIHDHAWTFSDDPVVVTASDYHKRAIRAGELIAADETTAKDAGIAFKDPGELLALYKKWAGEAWTTVHCHDEHLNDDGEHEVPEALETHDFGPMPTAVARRKAAASEAAKAVSKKPEAPKTTTPPAQPGEGAVK